MVVVVSAVETDFKQQVWNSIQKRLHPVLCLDQMPDGFAATVNGTLIPTRRVVIATGIIDETPSLPGLRDAMDLAYLTGQRPSDVIRMDETKIRDGMIEIRQGKTGAALRMEIAGELAAVIERIKARKRAAAIYTTRLVVDHRCKPLTLGRISDHFVRARLAAGIEPASFQFRDLRAKAGTDKADSAGDIRQAQKQLGHSSVTMTEAYVRRRRGDKTSPTK